MTQPPETDERKPISWLYVIGGLLVALVAVSLLTRSGRHSSDDSRHSSSSNEEVHQDELFDYAIDTVNRLEEFNTTEMLKRAIDRLDLWVRDQPPRPDWQPDPMLDTLPEPFQELPVLAGLGELSFTLEGANSDGMALQQAVWLRDLSSWAGGDEIGDVDRALHLFDWTVRNVQLERQVLDRTEGLSARVLQKPWETLMLGRGSAEERAWVFILLARQQGLDAAMIGPAVGQSPEEAEAAARLVGVLSGTELYLFDMELGLPVPAPEGPGLDEANRLVVRPATLSQVVADDALLRQFDVENHPYPLHAEQLAGATAWIEASPVSLSKRMQMVEEELAGDDKLVLTAYPAAQAERINMCPQVGQVQLWTLPYWSALQEVRYGPDRQEWESIQFAPLLLVDTLWRGRSYHLRGKFEGTPSAIDYYQKARPSNNQLAALGPNDQMRNILLLAKLNASYWLGLLSAGQGNDRAAEDYLDSRTIRFAPNSPWTHGAIYNLARILEARDTAAALGLYQLDVRSPCRHGNLVRAKWLETLTGVEFKMPEVDEPAAPPEESSEAEPDGDPAPEEPTETSEEAASQPPKETTTGEPAPESPKEEPSETPEEAAPQPSGGEAAPPEDGNSAEAEPSGASS